MNHQYSYSSNHQKNMQMKYQITQFRECSSVFKALNSGNSYNCFKSYHSLTEKVCSLQESVFLAAMSINGTLYFILMQFQISLNFIFKISFLILLTSSEYKLYPRRKILKQAAIPLMKTLLMPINSLYTQCHLIMSMAL